MYFLVWEKSKDKSIITQSYFTWTLKKDRIIYYCRHVAEQKGLFLYFFFIFIFFEIFLEKQCVKVGLIEIERSYVKQTFRQDTFCCTLESLE